MSLLADADLSRLAKRTSPTVTVLNVNDDEAHRYLISRTLGRAGFGVVEAASGSEALDLLAAGNVDVVVLDVRLPDGDGRAVCRTIKAASVPPLPVVLISALCVSDSDRVQGFDNGADMYLTAPVAGEVLIACVDALVRAHRTLADVLERERAARAAAEEARRIQATLMQANDELLLREQAAREQADAANRGKDGLLAVIAHELRTPLSTVLGACRLLERVGTASSEAAKARGIIDRQTRRMAALVDDLLDWNRLASGALRLDVRPIDLGKVTADCLETLATAGELDGRALDASTESVWVRADPSRIEQIVSNLVGNAVKFTPRDGRVRVETGLRGGEALLRVTDDGEGIAPEVLPRVFEPFFTGGGSSSGSGGLGIGLALVRQLVEAHGGSVEAASTGPGRGAGFTVRLPAVPAAPHLDDGIRTE